WFVDSASGASTAHRDWYVWSATDPGWTPPWGGSNDTWYLRNGSWYYGVFFSGMPDLNYRTQAVRDEMKRISKVWLDKGVAGFRSLSTSRSPGRWSTVREKGAGPALAPHCSRRRPCIRPAPQMCRS